MNLRERLMQSVNQPVRFEVEGVGEVFIRKMSLGEADTLNTSDAPDSKQSNSVRLLARFLSDDKGVPVFDLGKEEDVKALRDLPVTVAAKLLELGNQVNAPPDKGDKEKKG